mmetsp:Transcript_86129/g.152156  ORF Transcript_86129/g.152156 Transcript_86129/m.152156 type:complete len:843 (-) Transcript_86129:163-2691(-)
MAQVWLPVLRKFCSDTVVSHFDGLRSKQQSTMLEALGASVDAVVQRCMNTWIEQACGKASQEEVVEMMHSNRNDVDHSCPLVYALKQTGKQVHCVPGLETALSDLKGHVLPKWGLPEKKVQLLQQFNAGLLRHMSQLNRAQDPAQSMLTTSNSAARKEDISSKSWQDLRKVMIKDLDLFRSKTGARLDGSLKTKPMYAAGCVATVIEDDEGDVIRLGLYNMVGATSQANSEKLFPDDMKLTIMEPYLKIMADGSLGVRVDNPAEVISHKQGSEGIAELKRSGNDAFAAGDFELAVLRYEEALHHQEAENVHVALSNRAQAYLSDEQAANALTDAAAALLLRPKSPKAWTRFVKSLGCLPSGDAPIKAETVMKAALGSQSPRVPATECTDSPPESLIRHILAHVAPIACNATRDCSYKEWKEEGNASFKDGDFASAVESYTAALAFPAAQSIASVLSNLAAAALKLGRAQDALAYAVAATRVGVISLYPGCAVRVHGLQSSTSLNDKKGTCTKWDEAANRWCVKLADGQKQLKPENLELANDVTQKAWYRMGQALVLLRCFRAAGLAFEHCSSAEASSASAELPELVKRAQMGYSFQDLFAERHQSAVEFVGAVKMAQVANKGRGLVATSNIDSEKCILVCRAAVSEVAESKDVTWTNNSSTKSRDSSSQSKAHAWLVRNAAENAALRRRLDPLSDGITTPDVVPMKRLMQTLDLECAPPLLTTRAPFVTDTTAVDARRLERIFDINSHGSNNVGPRSVEEAEVMMESLSKSDPRSGFSCLYPLVALLNHSRHPNAEIYPMRLATGDAVAVITRASVAAGEELTISYSSDPEALERRWGISSP